MSNGVTAVNTVSSTTVQGSITDPNSGTLEYLPTRAEKRFVPVRVSSNSSLIEKQVEVNRTIEPMYQLIQRNDFFITPQTYAKQLSQLVDYVKVVIPHRGLDSNMQQSLSTDAEFRFLINPTTLNINRQTVDAQSFTRGGWQFGVWGEDVFMVQMQGVSAGSYFSLGLTDEYSYYTESYRNVMQLQQVFENNGYWFEGEEANEGPLAPGYLRRRIRVHQDVELHAANFIWYGMFDSFVISQDAEKPFLLNFSLSFFAWKERFRNTSPYNNTIQNDTQRGHSYSAVQSSITAQNAQNQTSAQTPIPSVANQNTQVNSAVQSVGGAYSNSPAVLSSITTDSCTVPSAFSNGGSSDFIGTTPLSNLFNPQGSLFNY